MVGSTLPRYEDGHKNHQSHDNLDERLLVNALNATCLQLQSGSRQLEKTVA